MCVTGAPLGSREGGAGQVNPIDPAASQRRASQGHKLAGELACQGTGDSGFFGPASPSEARKLSTQRVSGEEHSLLPLPKEPGL